MVSSEKEGEYVAVPQEDQEGKEYIPVISKGARNRIRKEFMNGTMLDDSEGGRRGWLPRLGSRNMPGRSRTARRMHLWFNLEYCYFHSYLRKHACLDV